MAQVLRRDLQDQGGQVQESIVTHVEFSPGQTAPMHFHPGAQEILYVLEGNVTVEQEGLQTKVVDMGEAALTPADVTRRGACADVKEVTEVRARWLGHRLHAEVNVTLPSQTTISAAHAIAEEVRHQLLHHLKYLSLVAIYVDPEEKSGERYHRIELAYLRTHTRRNFLPYEASIYAESAR